MALNRFRERRGVLPGMLVVLVVLVALVGGAACGDGTPPPGAAAGVASERAVVPHETAPQAPEPSPEPEPEPDPFARPEWLGQRPLPLRADGFGQVLPTPPELVDRRLATPALLPPPPDGSFHASVSEVPADVAARSTWHPGCPVSLDELRYVRVSFWGFDGGHHSGELLVHRDLADDVVHVFGRLHEARFPLEEVRVTRAEELDAHPTGDGNNSAGFVCRPSVGSSSWSQHAYGKAVDLNPFHNPFLRGDVVIPELASAYLDRDNVRPGMIVDGDVVVTAFAEVGWAWGGHWRSAKDWMHFSPSGR